MTSTSAGARKPGDPHFDTVWQYDFQSQHRSQSWIKSFWMILLLGNICFTFNLPNQSSAGRFYLISHGSIFLKQSAGACPDRESDIIEQKKEKNILMPCTLSLHTFFIMYSNLIFNIFITSSCNAFLHFFKLGVY